MKAPSFDIIVKKEFKFLEKDYNFKLVESRNETWGYSFTYLSDKVGVKITYEYTEAFVFIMLYQLIEGKLIQNTGTINDKTTLYGYALDEIVNLRNPSALIKPAYTYGSNSAYYDKENGLSLYVRDFAKNLQEYASDVLKGNFEIFKETDRIVKERAKKYS